MASTSTVLKAEAINQIFQQYFGFAPKISYGNDYASFSFTKEQQVILRNFIEKHMDASPGEIRFDLNPIIIPIALRKIAPYLAGSAVLGFLVGRKKKS